MAVVLFIALASTLVLTRSTAAATDGTQVVTRPGFVTATLNSVVVNTAFLGPCYNASLLSESATIPY